MQVSPDAVIRLCDAVRTSAILMVADEPARVDLLSVAEVARAAVTADPIDHDEVLTSVRRIRYILIEAGDGPIAAIMADSAARILGDDIGTIFA
jgi:hypothetical protein